MSPLSASPTAACVQCMGSTIVKSTTTAGYFCNRCLWSPPPLFVAVSWLQYSANKTGNQQRGGWISPPVAFFWPNVVLHRPSSSALLSICQPARNRTKPHHRLLSAYQWPLKHHSPKTTMYLASLSLSLTSLPPIRVCSIIHSFPLKGINSTFVFPYPRLYAAAAAQGVRRLRWTESANDKCVPVQPTSQPLVDPISFRSRKN